MTVNQRNLQVQATEVHLSTHPHNLRSTSEFKLENLKTVHYGAESLSFLGPKIWELVPLAIKPSHL